MPFVLAFVVPKTDVPETDAPETDAPETDVPETDVPETDVPERDGELLFFFNIVESFSGSSLLVVGLGWVCMRAFGGAHRRKSRLCRGIYF